MTQIKCYIALEAFQRIYNKYVYEAHWVIDIEELAIDWCDYFFGMWVNSFEQY